MTTDTTHLTCAGCSGEFLGTKQQRGRAADGKKVYCSRDCQKAGHRVDVMCAGCEGSFSREKYLVDRNETGRFFCSAECRDRVGSKPKTGRYVPCENNCGQDVYVIPAVEGKAHLCSVACKDAWQRRHRTMRVCAHCGEEFEVRPSDVDRYCTRQCYGASKRAPVGHRYIEKDGYVRLWIDDGQDGARPVPEHRHVMSQHLGRELYTWETVDHRTGGYNGRSDNRLENLRLMVGKHPRGHEPENVRRYCREMLGLYGTDEERARYAADLAAMVEDREIGDPVGTAG